MIAPALSVYVTGLLDIAITMYVILLGIGEELNPIYNWVHEPALMCIVMLVANLAFGLLVISLPDNHYSRLGSYGFAASRVVVGAGSGFAILMGVV